MRKFVFVAPLLAAAVASGQQQPVTTPVAPAPARLPYPTLGERLRYEVRGVVGLGSLVAGLAVAGIEQWNGDPPGVGQGAAGYGTRLGFYYGQLATAKALEFGIGAALHEDPRPSPSHLQGVWPRTWYAIKHTFVVPNDNHGETVAIFRLAGSYGGAFMSNVWYPSEVNGTGDALVRGTFNLAGSVGNSIVREFWPDVKRRVLHKKP
jgi:hypothetical protein